MNKTRKIVKKGIALGLVLTTTLTVCPKTEASAKTNVKLNKTKVTLTVGKSTTLKLKGYKKKVKWSSSSKKIATVSTKGKVKAKKAGKVTITAKAGKKKYTCKVTVKAAKKKNVIPTTTQQPTTQQPTTQQATAQQATTQQATTQQATTQQATTQQATTQQPTTQQTTAQQPTTQQPTTQTPDYQEPTTQQPTNNQPVDPFADWVIIDNGNGVTISNYMGSDSYVTIPSSINGETVTEIRSGAFSNNSTITSITIPSTVTTIQSGAFNDCKSLTTINVDSSNANFISLDGVLYNNTMDTLIACPAKKETVYIPNTVQNIDDNAFNSCGSLTKVTIPDTVRNMSPSLFANASQRLKLAGKAGSYIEQYAFSNHIEFESLTWGNESIFIQVPDNGEKEYDASEIPNTTSLSVSINNQKIDASKFNVERITPNKNYSLPGKYTYSVTIYEDSYHANYNVKKEYIIKPRKSDIKVANVTIDNKLKLKLSYDQDKLFDHYEIQVCSNSDFSENDTTKIGCFKSSVETREDDEFNEMMDILTLDLNGLKNDLSNGGLKMPSGRQIIRIRTVWRGDTQSEENDIPSDWSNYEVVDIPLI